MHAKASGPGLQHAVGAGFHAVFNPQRCAEDGEPSALTVVQRAEVHGLVHGAALGGHPRLGHQGVLVKHLLILGAVIHLQGCFRDPLVHVVVLRGHNERVVRVVEDVVQQIGLDEFLQGWRARIVDGGRVVGAVQEVQHGRGVRLLEHLVQVLVKRAVDAVPSNHVVGQIRGVGVRRCIERQGELGAADVVRTAPRGCAAQRELVAVGGGGQISGKRHGGVATLGIARDEVLAVQGVPQFSRQRIGRFHHEEACV